MYVKKNGKWEDEGGEVTADKLQEVIENNQEQLGSVIQEACTASGNNISVLPGGGSIGQVLAKVSDKNGDVDWIDPTSSENCVKFSDLTLVDGDIPTTQQMQEYFQLLKSKFIL